MNGWRKQPLRIRLTLWHAGVSSLILIILAVFVFEEVEHRLRAEVDGQLRSDFDFVKAELEEGDIEERIEQRARGADGGEDHHRRAVWFEVWSRAGESLLREGPEPEKAARSSLEPPAGRALAFRTAELEKGFFVRLMERPARIRGRAVTIRVFRDLSPMRHSLREIATVLWAGVPLAVLLSAAGGFFIAGRSLAPVGSMAEQARKITAESLDERLPVNNPDDELGRLAMIFNQTIERLDRSFRELRRFTADASHELRTPLTALRSVGEVGLQGLDDPEALRETVSSMLEEAQHLNDLIDSLLVLCRADSGLAKAHLQPIELGEFLVDISGSLEVLAQEEQQSVSLEIQPGTAVHADPVLLRQAVMNILFNALRYSPARSPIQVRARRDAGDTAIEIEDRGPGIPREHREKIFERFYRVDKARSRSEGGSGLGLAIAKWAVERQGGRIELESEPGRGSLFRIILPSASR